MTDLALIERERATAEYPQAVASIEQQMREAAAAYDGDLTVVSLFICRHGASTLRALVADRGEFQAWAARSKAGPQPFSFFIEAPLALH